MLTFYRISVLALRSRPYGFQDTKWDWHFVFQFSDAKKEAQQGCASLEDTVGNQAVLAALAVVVSAAASLPRIKARRIGLITNSASSAAVALSATAMTNTACQP
jgi:hypothetical protein